VKWTRAGLTIVPVVPWEAPRPDQLPNFSHACLTFESSVYGLNVTTTKKVNFLGEEKCTREAPAEKILKRIW